ncbi:Hypothetical protein, putative [Bodo saltans]|uniref:Uncharacterized protein n=1 Tax=Bodo saltans TaxID=75058 RepID=A0A0S4J308_BODSA|nr:Hypothetical protein, putative [Bodo saltans]|eukprot:CUG66953.1 Hypothetical protein, putative [Bodo saltans]
MSSNSAVPYGGGGDDAAADGSSSAYPSGQGGDYGDYMPPTIPFDFSMPGEGPWVAPDGVGQ